MRLASYCRTLRVCLQVILQIGPLYPIIFFYYLIYELKIFFSCEKILIE
jgi:hypothetical protein